MRSALAALIQHNICTHCRNARNIIEYSVLPDDILLRNRFPRFIYSAKSLYGDTAELIIEEVLNNGRMPMSCVCQHIADKLEEAATAADGQFNLKHTL